MSTGTCIHLALRIALIATVAAIAFSVPDADAYHVADATPTSRTAKGRSVALSDASEAPTWKRTLAAGRSIDAPFCDYTDVHVYRHDGSAFGRQYTPRGYAAHEMKHEWRAFPSARRAVGFGQGHFYNGTTVRVVVAVWCEA